MSKYRSETAVGAPPSGTIRHVSRSRRDRLMTALADLVPRPAEHQVVTGGGC